MPLLNRTGGGGGEDVSAEVARQKELLDEMESLYKGKTTGADATEADILEGKKAYVGRNLITGTHPDVTAEVEEQTPLIQQIREAIVGKATLANATADKIVKGYSAYVGQELVNGTLEPLDLAKIFGCSEMNIETFTYPSNRECKYSINHSLGKIPKVVLISNNGSELSANYALISYLGIFNNGNSINGSTIYKYTGGNFVRENLGGYITESTVSIGSGLTSLEFYDAGVEYTLVTMA